MISIQVSQVSLLELDMCTEFTPLSGQSQNSGRPLGERHASRRDVPRQGQAYRVMGILGLHVAIIYSEGRRSFQRLQREISQRSPLDRSVCSRESILPIHTAPFRQPSGNYIYHLDSYANVVCHRKVGSRSHPGE